MVEAELEKLPHHQSISPKPIGEIHELNIDGQVYDAGRCLDTLK
jgi:hypothetical protein